MYCNVIFRFLLVIFILCRLVSSRSKLNDELRPDTTIIYNNYSICRGPKAANLTKYTAILERNEKDYVAVLNITVLEDIVVDESRIIVYAKNKNMKTLLWNYKLKNPCKNFGFALLLKPVTNSSDCEVKQGTYYARMSVAEFLEKSVGTAMVSSVLNGDYSFKMLVLSKKGNLFCVTGDVTYEFNSDK